MVMHFGLSIDAERLSDCLPFDPSDRPTDRLNIGDRLPDRRETITRIRKAGTSIEGPSADHRSYVHRIEEDIVAGLTEADLQDYSAEIRFLELEQPSGRVVEAINSWSDLVDFELNDLARRMSKWKYHPGHDHWFTFDDPPEESYEQDRSVSMKRSYGDGEEKTSSHIRFRWFPERDLMFRAGYSFRASRWKSISFSCRDIDKYRREVGINLQTNRVAFNISREAHDRHVNRCLNLLGVDEKLRQKILRNYL